MKLTQVSKLGKISVIDPQVFSLSRGSNKGKKRDRDHFLEPWFLFCGVVIITIPATYLHIRNEVGDVEMLTERKKRRSMSRMDSCLQTEPFLKPDPPC